MATNHADQSVLTVDEAHSSLGKNKISRAGFYSAIKRGEVPHVRLGKRILIPKHAFLRWLEPSTAQLQILGIGEVDTRRNSD